MAAHQNPIEELPGLLYMPAFIECSEQDNLLAFIEGQTHWIPLGKKRRLPFGALYSVGNRTIAKRLGPLPSILHTLAVRFVEAGLMREVADQAIVQEYQKGQGIKAHVDADCFGPDVISLSLLSPCVMRFTHATMHQRRDLVLEPLSALAITGEARTAWLHEIPAYKQRDRRLSITFRTVVSGS